MSVELITDRDAVKELFNTANVKRVNETIFKELIKEIIQEERSIKVITSPHKEVYYETDNNELYPILLIIFKDGSLKEIPINLIPCIDINPELKEILQSIEFSSFNYTKCLELKEY